MAFRIAFLLVLLALLPSPPVHAQVVDTAVIRRVAERELDRRPGTPGAVAAVVHRDSAAVRISAFGKLHEQSSEPMRPDLVFGTADFDEVLIALAAAVLHANGGVGLYDPVRTIMADLPPRLGAITLAQLLSHTAGLDDADDDTPPRRPVSRIWPEATDRAFFTEPGAIYSPSRYGNRLARALLERRTGRSIADLVRELVLDPLGMKRSTFDGARAEQLGAADGHVVSTSMERPIVALTPAENPHPQFFSSADDMARLSLALLGGGRFDGRQALPAVAVEEALRPRAARPSVPGDSVALGWRVGRVRGLQVVAYSGGIAGYGITLQLVPEAGAAFAVLANGTGAVLTATADTALAASLAALGRHGGPAETAAPQATATPDGAAAFAGTYANGDRVVVLEMRNGELFWVDGDLVLPVRRDGALFHVIVADGRVARTFHRVSDAAGNPYLILEDRAYRRTAR